MSDAISAPDRHRGNTPSSDTVSLALAQAIHEQRLEPGIKLGEGELADIYGVSRTIIRFVLQKERACVTTPFGGRNRVMATDPGRANCVPNRWHHTRMLSYETIAPRSANRSSISRVPRPNPMGRPDGMGNDGPGEPLALQARL